MTTKIGSVVFIEKEEAQPCGFCDQRRECRPYGPNKRQICYQCAQKPEFRETVARNATEFITGRQREATVKYAMDFLAKRNVPMKKPSARSSAKH